MLPCRIRFLWLISQLWTCYPGQDFSCFLHVMLELLPSVLKLRHLLLDLPSSLSLITQLFFKLLDATECLLQSPCQISNFRDVV